MMGETRARAGEPERRLMAAVLQRVVDDCRADFRHHRKAMVYAASEDRGWPFSFANLCEALGLDADCLRKALLNGGSSWRERPATSDAAAAHRAPDTAGRSLPG